MRAVTLLVGEKKYERMGVLEKSEFVEGTKKHTRTY